MQRIVVVVAAALSLTLPAFARSPLGGSPRVAAVLDGASSPPDLRARLQAFAEGDTSRADRGEALYWAGVSFEREGNGDSAIVCYERAVELRAEADEVDALAEALFKRGTPADLARAREILDRRYQRARLSSEIEAAQTRARQAWALYLAGQPDSAAIGLAAVERRLLTGYDPFEREWRYRIGAAEVQHDRRRAIEFMRPLALASRLQDVDVMGIIMEASGDKAMGQRAGQTIANELGRLDRIEDAEIARLGWRRVSFAGGDGFPLSGLVAPARATGRATSRARAAVFLLPHDHGPASWDTLTSALRAGGWSVMLVEVRGSGRSVHPRCPLPESWRGREADLAARTARDVVPALRALAAAAPVDTSRYLVGGAKSTASMAVEAATLDRRARVLVLVSPLPSPVDRGVMRSRLAALDRPVFLQSAPEDVEAVPVAEMLFHAVDGRVSRLAESDRVGGGPNVFRHDPSALPRLTRWLAEAWPRAATPAPRRSGPRGG